MSSQSRHQGQSDVAEHIVEEQDAGARQPKREATSEDKRERPDDSADVEPADTKAPIPEGLQTLRYRARYCFMCTAVVRDGPSHKTRTKHENRKLTLDEVAHLESQWWLEQSRGKAEVRTQVLEQEKKRQDAAQIASAEPQVAGEEEPYRFDFGFYKNKRFTVEEAHADNPEYLAYLLLNNVDRQRPSLKTAIEAAGLWDRCRAQADGMKSAKKAKLLEYAAKRPTGDHKDVKRLRRIELQELFAEEASADVMPTAVRAVADMPGRPKLARSHKSRTRQMLAHCSHCGSWRHKTPRCPQLLASGSPDEGNLVEFAKVRNKRKRKLVAHLKYTNIDQRCGVYEGRPFLEYSRLPPLELAAVLTVDGLSVDMTGAPCPHPKCLETKVAFNKERVSRR